MSPVISHVVLALVLAAGPDASTDTTAEVEPPRGYHEISGEMRDAMKREATADSHAERARAIHDLADLYLEVVEDPRLPLAPTLQKYKATMWSRLLRVKKDLQRQIAREEKQANPHARPAREVDPDVQQEASEASRDIASQMTYIGYTMGGPAAIITDAGAMGGAAVDSAAALVDLIERVLSPEFWDTNGGPGSIFYYRQVHALVITATDEMHGNISNTLNGLRRAGM